MSEQTTGISYRVDGKKLACFSHCHLHESFVDYEIKELQMKKCLIIGLLSFCSTAFAADNCNYNRNDGSSQNVAGLIAISTPLLSIAELKAESFISIDDKGNCSRFTAESKWIKNEDDAQCGIYLAWATDGNCVKVAPSGKSLKNVDEVECIYHAKNDRPALTTKSGMYVPPDIRICGGLIVVENGVERIVSNPNCK